MNILLESLAHAIKTGRHWHVFLRGVYVCSYWYNSSAQKTASEIGGTVRYLTNVPINQQRRNSNA